MFSRSLSGVALILVLAGCGSSTPHAAVPTNAPPRATMMQARPLSQARVPSEKILRRWTTPSSPEAIGYADLGTLFNKELVRGLASAGMLAARNYAPKESIDCALEWMSSVREIAGFVNGDDGLLILTYEPSALKTPLDRCIQTFGSPPRVEMGPKLQAYALDNAVLIIEPDVVLFGRRQLVEASLANQASGKWPDALALGKDQQLVFSGREREDQLDIKGYLSVTDGQFVLHADVTFPDKVAAKVAADLMSPERVKREVSGQGQQAQAVSDLISETWHVRQAGPTVAFEFGVTGKPEVIAERLGMVSALAVYGVRKYVADAKAAEARATVGLIAKQIVASHPKRLTSLPPIPSKFEVLQGKKYQSAPADWAKWKSIDFSLNEPQYYQYRVDAAKNGKSAEIIAEGDLDGNGRKSQFSLSLRFDAKTGELQVAPELKQQDATE